MTQCLLRCMRAQSNRVYDPTESSECNDNMQYEKQFMMKVSAVLLTYRILPDNDPVPAEVHEGPI